MTAEIARLCLKGDLDGLKLKLAKYPRDEQLTKIKATNAHSLHWAILNGHRHIIKYMLELGITADDIACSRMKNIGVIALNGDVAMLELLFDHGLTVDEVMINQSNDMLVDICKRGHIGILQCLFDHGMPLCWFEKDVIAVACDATAVEPHDCDRNHVATATWLLEHIDYTDDEKELYGVPAELRHLSPDIGPKYASKF